MEVFFSSGRGPPTTQQPSESVELILSWHNRAQTTLSTTKNNLPKTVHEFESHLLLQGRTYVLLTFLRGAYLT